MTKMTITKTMTIAMTMTMMAMKIILFNINSYIQWGSQSELDYIIVMFIYYMYKGYN